MLDYQKQFLESLNKHRQYVIEAAEIAGWGSDDLLMRRLLVHDLSKFSPEEFDPYAVWFYGGKTNPTEFLAAWQHHLHANDHHWEYWVVHGFNFKGADVSNDCLYMPMLQVTEMVCDWMGASMAYTGSYDMTGWLKGNLGRVRLHPQSAKHLRMLLVDMGYAFVESTPMAGE